jgi:hypothetical protein
VTPRDPIATFPVISHRHVIQSQHPEIRSRRPKSVMTYPPDRTGPPRTGALRQEAEQRRHQRIRAGSSAERYGISRVPNNFRVERNELNVERDNLNAGRNNVEPDRDSFFGALQASSAARIFYSLYETAPRSIRPWGSECLYAFLLLPMILPAYPLTLL